MTHVTRGATSFTSMGAVVPVNMKLVVGYIPEHFSAPIFMAQSQKYFQDANVEVELKPFPSGSGHLIQCLTDGSIDISIGLTEAHIKAIACGSDAFKLVSIYVNSPLCWAVSTGIDRSDIQSLEDIRGKRIGISRFGSGSELMARVLEKQKGWEETPFSYHVNNDFKNLRDGVNLTGTAEPTEAFMWEHFTSKRYYDQKVIKRVGEIYTPWPSWVISASPKVLEQKDSLIGFLTALSRGIDYFNSHHTEALEWITSNLDYTLEDATSWLETVEFNTGLKGVPDKVVDTTLEILSSAAKLPDNAKLLEYVSKA